MASSDRLIEIFSEATAQPAGVERERFLAEACREEPELKEQVLSLLQAHEGAGDFLKPTILISPTALPTEKPGDRIGRYKLLQQIGEGGCGVVYMAEQEEPVRRKVALKVIKLGMDTKSVIARFEAERQALALMDHPNIAKVLDAGATEKGRPYFVMELVRGVKITDFCDENNVPTADRLKLFIQVCQAIQHAHQKGVIHRDIKPSNILVTVNDGVPVPKVIDFGIAKATQGRLTDQTLFTAFEQFLGTPAYMSPEQAVMTNLDIDTRSDIYSLGVLLYELLTGRTPFDQKELLAAGLDEMRRTIREKAPLKPSTRLTQELVAAPRQSAADLRGEDGSALPRRRSAEIQELIHLLRGDLDWIVMKCLEKDRARRYETANGLARDIERHLSNEPVIARPPSRLYEFQKTVRRHKFGFAAAAALITVLAIGVVVSTWEASRAKTEAAKAIAISEFLQQLLGSANPGALKSAEYTVRQLLDDFSAGLGKQLEGQSEVEATLRSTMGNAYLWLGLYDKAQPHLERAVALRGRLYGEQSQEVAQSLVDLAWNLGDQGRRFEAETATRRALDIYRRRGTAAQPVIHALNALAVFLLWEERFKEVETVSEQALALARNSPQRDFPEIANTLHNLADAYVRQKKYVEAEGLALRAVEMHRRLQGPEHPETAWGLLFLGRALAGQHKLAEAERAYREALTIFRKYYSFRDYSVDTVMTELSLVLEAKGDSAAAEALFREVLDGQRAALGNDSPAVAEALMKLAARLYAQGKQDEAHKALSEAREVILKVRDHDYDKLPPGVRQLARALASQGKSQEADALFEDAIALAHQKLGETNLVLGQLLHDYGDFLQRENKPKAAADYHLKALPIRRAHPDDELGWTLSNLAGELVSLGRPQEAEAYYREAIALYRQLHQREDIGGTAWRSQTLGDALYQQHKLPEAEQAYRDALAIYAKCQAQGSEDCARAVRSLLDVLKAENKLAEGEALCREILAQQRAAASNDTPAVAETLTSLATSLYALGKQAEAEQASHEAMEIILKLRATDHDKLPAAVRRLAERLQSQGKSQYAEQLYSDAIHATRQATGESDPVLGELLDDYGEFLEGAGLLDEAEAEYHRTLTLSETARADFPSQAVSTERLTVVQARLAKLVRWRGLLREAKPAYWEAAERGGVEALNECAWFLAACIDSKVRDGTNAIVFAEKAVAATNRRNANYLDTLAAAYAETGQFTQAIKIQQEAIAVSQSEREKKDLAAQLVLYANRSPRRDRFSLAGLAGAWLRAGKPTEAQLLFREMEPALREDLALRKQRFGEVHRQVDEALATLARLLEQAGKLAEAETVWREELEMERKLSGDEHPFVANSLQSLANVLRAQGKLPEAEILLREEVSRARKLATDGPSGEISSLGLNLHHLAEVLRERKMLAEARSLAEEAAAMYRRHPDWPANERQHAFAVLEAVLTDLGESAELEALLREQLQTLRPRLAPDDPQLAGAIAQLTTTLLHESKFTLAEPFARECLTIREKKLPDDWRTFNTRSMLGGSLLGQKKYAEAEPLLLSGYEGMKQREEKIPLEGKPRLQEALQRLVQLYEATRRPDQAAEWKQKLAAFGQAQAEEKAPAAKP